MRKFDKVNIVIKSVETLCQHIYKIKQRQSELERELQGYKNDLAWYVEKYNIKPKDIPGWAIRTVQNERTTYKTSIIDALIESGLLNEKLILQAKSVSENSFITIKKKKQSN